MLIKRSLLIAFWLGLAPLGAWADHDLMSGAERCGEKKAMGSVFAELHVLGNEPIKVRGTENGVTLIHREGLKFCFEPFEMPLDFFLTADLHTHYDQPDGLNFGIAARYELLYFKSFRSYLFLEFGHARRLNIGSVSEPPEGIKLNWVSLRATNNYQNSLYLEGFARFYLDSNEPIGRVPKGASTIDIPILQSELGGLARFQLKPWLALVVEPKFGFTEGWAVGRFAPEGCVVFSVTSSTDIKFCVRQTLPLEKRYQGAHSVWTGVIWKF